jgi:hypothetical protein
VIGIAAFVGHRRLGSVLAATSASTLPTTTRHELDARDTFADLPGGGAVPPPVQEGWDEEAAWSDDAPVQPRAAASPGGGSGGWQQSPPPLAAPAGNMAPFVAESRTEAVNVDIVDDDDGDGWESF